MQYARKVFPQRADYILANAKILMAMGLKAQSTPALYAQINPTVHKLHQYIMMEKRRPPIKIVLLRRKEASKHIQ